MAYKTTTYLIQGEPEEIVTAIQMMEADDWAVDNIVKLHEHLRYVEEEDGLLSVLPHRISDVLVVFCKTDELIVEFDDVTDF